VPVTGSAVPPPFRLAYVPGVTPDKWVRIWRERSPDHPLTLSQLAAADAAAIVRDRGTDAVLLRLPTDRTGLHAIPLYTEQTVIVVPKDHLLAAAEDVSPTDVADEMLLSPGDDVLDWTEPPGRRAVHEPATTTAAVELVAAGAGLLVVPQSLARLHHRRDLTYRPFPAAPESRVALAWLEDETTDAIEQFIGIVRGRTPNSTRGRPSTPAVNNRSDTETRKTTARKPATGSRRRTTGAPRSGGYRKPRRRT
jgi:DNA-binding transcriptional LysR family regulator